MKVYVQVMVCVFILLLTTSINCVSMNNVFCDDNPTYGLIDTRDVYVFSIGTIYEITDEGDNKTWVSINGISKESGLHFNTVQNYVKS